MSERDESLSELSAVFADEETEPERGRPDDDTSPAADAQAEGPEGSAAATDARAEGPEVGGVPEEGGAPPSRGPRWGRWALGALVVVFAAAAAVFGVLWWQEANEGADEEAVRDVASRFTANLVTFDYETLEEDIDRIQQDATGGFAGELATALGGDITVFRDAIVEAEAVSTGTVHGVIVQGISDETAQVMAVADQRIVNKDNPEPRTIPRRIRLTLVKTTDGWKVDEVDALALGG